ncbi:hypothetical protein GF359_02035 [candidate division WOR-3 bacterium]|uniref:Uncharacterized protein n=1 Tax=candidate division WOR-3 bacterium TaxID=2052148 RepID=A0A9D5QBZ4_UNCW3|nr:hypothetical protein [candidate division WOR-3 bacterium]MBD3363974.1 hypothetical protein [candidate division WOR-3 bacterium]
MSRKMFYPSKGYLKERLADYLEKRYSEKEFEIQTLEARDAESRGYIFQARKWYSTRLAETASKLTGLDLAVTVKIRQVADSLDIEVGGGKWLDKAAVAGFGLFVAFSILVIPAGIGAVRQHNLIEEVARDIDSFLNNPEQYGAGKEVEPG